MLLISGGMKWSGSIGYFQRFGSSMFGFVRKPQVSEDLNRYLFCWSLVYVHQIWAELGSMFGLLGDIHRFDVQFLGDKPKFGKFKGRSVQIGSVWSSVILGSFHHYYFCIVGWTCVFLVELYHRILETRVFAVLWNFTRHFLTILDARVFAVLQSLNHFIHFAVMSNQQLHGLLSMKFQRKFPKHDQRASTSAVISSSDWSTYLNCFLNSLMNTCQSL